MNNVIFKKLFYTKIIAMTIVFLFIAFLFFPLQTSAQQKIYSNIWKTCLINANDPSECSQSTIKSDEIVSWAKKINDALEPGYVYGQLYYQKLTTNISNGSYTAQIRYAQDTSVNSSGIYWCTNTVIDAYNLAGVTGLGRNQQAVVSMDSFWRNTPGYVYLNYMGGNHKDTLLKLKPGYAFFLESQRGVHTGHEHTGIISEVKVDSNGNGYIKTYESNSGLKTWIYIISDWDVHNTYYPLVAFGGV